MKKLILPVIIFLSYAPIKANAGSFCGNDSGCSEAAQKLAGAVGSSTDGLYGSVMSSTSDSTEGSNTGDSSKSAHFASKNYRNCETLTMSYDNKFNPIKFGDGQEYFNRSAEAIYLSKKDKNNLCNKLSDDDISKISSEKNKQHPCFGDDFNRFDQYAQMCNAMAFYLNSAELKPSDFKSKPKEVTSDAKGPLEGAKCESNGIDTIDYKSCAFLLDTVSAATVAVDVGGQVADLNTQLKGSNLTSNLSNKPGDEFNAALKAQKDSMDNVKENLTTKMALSATRMGLVIAARQKYKVAEDEISKCAKSGLPLGNDPSLICDKAATTFNLFPNQEAYEKITGILVKDGADIVKNTMVNNYLDKNMNSIDNLMNTVKTFNPMQPTAQELQMMKCQAQPTLPECQTMMNQSVDMVGTDAFTFGGGMGLTYNPGQTTEEDPFASNNNNGPGSVGNPLKPLGSAISPSGKKGGGLVAGNAPGVDSKLNSTSGSTGGGGGLGGGGGGGGAPAPKGDGGPSAAKVPAVKSISYTGGDGINLTGGSGLRNVKRDEKSDGGNPFDSLFGKNKGGSNSGVTNFREPAALGAKNGDIFQMISNAYSRSDANGRLMKYELSN